MEIPGLSATTLSALAVEEIFLFRLRIFLVDYGQRWSLPACTVTHLVRSLIKELSPSESTPLVLE